MSHYARIIEPVDGHAIATGERVTIGGGAEIKCVKVNNFGGFDFDARFDFDAGPAWVRVRTDDDLPGHTDKGMAHRERQKHVTLRPGRPLEGEEQVLRPIALRVAEVQRAWVLKRAKRHGLTVSEYLRELLISDGMPS